MIAPTIVCSNYKGGVGKSTTSRVLAQTLALDKEFTKGKPILVIDLDPQGNTSRRWKLLRTDSVGDSYPVTHPDLEGESPDYSSVCDLWLSLITKIGVEGLGESVYPIPYQTEANSMIHVVPAHEKLMTYAMSAPLSDRPNLGVALRQWLRSDEVGEAYSCVIIDTQPSKSALIDAALAAATHVYIPFVPEPQSVDGVFSILSYIFMQQQNRGTDVPLVLLGLLPNMVMNTMLHNTILNSFRKHEHLGKHLMPVKFGRRIAYAESDDHRNIPEQVTDMAGSTIDIEARKFARHVIKRLQE